MKYVPPYIVRKMFPSFQWESKSDKILLTFDDGPIADNTTKIIKKLEEYKLHALFLCVGENIKSHPSLINDLLLAGHIIGNHTLHHKNVTDKDFDASAELDQLNKAAFDNFGIKIKYFRPPHGKFNLSTPGLLKSHGLQSIMWTLLTYDFTNNFNEVKYSVDRYLKNNSIVVLHDSLKSKGIILDSIDYVVEQAGKYGYTIGTPEECLR